MQKDTSEKTASTTPDNTELIGILIAISVVAKRLASKLINEMKGDNPNGKDE